MGEVDDCTVQETAVSGDVVVALFTFASVTLILLLGISLFSI